MKKLIVFAAALLVSIAAFAQETNRDAEGNKVFGPYETNKFADNWVIGLGWNFPSTTSGPLWVPGVWQVGRPFKSGFALGAELFALKWIEPCYGVRFGWTGMQTYRAPEDDVWNLNYAHIDIMWNICNAWWGYKEGRKFEVSPYLSLAPFMRANKVLGTGAGAGIYATLRFNDRWGMFGDLGGILSDGKLIGHSNDTYNFWKAEIGLTYALGRTNWTRKATTVAAYTAAVAAAQAAADKAAADKAAAENAKTAAQDNEKALADENQKLKDELANSHNYGDLFDEPIVAYFEIGQAKLTAKEKEHVKYVAKNIIARGENVKFTLSGNADSKTGSKKRNQQLSEQRADYVYKMMTEELGIDGSRFTVKANGGNDIFDSPELNRAVIIEKQ